MDGRRELMRLRIDSRWSAAEMGKMCSALSDLYAIRFLLEFMAEETAYWRPRDYRLDPTEHRPRLWTGEPFGWASQLPPLWNETVLDRLFEDLDGSNVRLSVRRIRYESPGIVDLAGLGAIVGHLKDFVIRLVERRDARRQRELADEKAEIENERLRIENARQFVALAKEIGYSDLEIRQLAGTVDQRQGLLLPLVNQRKLVTVAKDKRSSDA